LERDGANKEAPNLVDPLEKRVKRGGMPQYQMWTRRVSDISDTEYKSQSIEWVSWSQHRAQRRKRHANLYLRGGRGRWL
jgi:hypothetical protein